MSVRHNTKIQSAVCAADVQIFWPSMIHSSPSRIALVATLVRSDPALGSEYPWQNRYSPLRILGRKWVFWSSVPYWSNVLPSIEMPNMSFGPPTGVPAFVSSSAITS